MHTDQRTLTDYDKKRYYYGVFPFAYTDTSTWIKTGYSLSHKKAIDALVYWMDQSIKKDRDCLGMISYHNPERFDPYRWKEYAIGYLQIYPNNGTRKIKENRGLAPEYIYDYAEAHDGLFDANSERWYVRNIPKYGMLRLDLKKRRIYGSCL